MSTKSRDQVTRSNSQHNNSSTDSKFKKICVFIGKICFSISILYACLYLGKFISSYLPIAFPGTIIGLLILFTLLELKIVTLKMLSPSANWLLKHMAALFIPAAVGVIAYLDQVYSSLTLIIFNSFTGIALIILVVGRSFQHFTEDKTKRQKRHKIYKRAYNIRKIKKLSNKNNLLNNTNTPNSKE